MGHDTLQPIQQTLSVPLPVDRAFALFVDIFTTWWPPEYTWAGDVLDMIAIEPHEGGRCYERGPHGFECDWGRVLVFERPRRVTFTWQISPRREPVPDPARASEVEVRFTATGADSARLELEHRGLERHGEGAAEYREALASPQGWPYILDRYAEAAAG